MSGITSTKPSLVASEQKLDFWQISSQAKFQPGSTKIFLSVYLSDGKTIYALVWEIITVVSACALAQKFRHGIKITAQINNFKLKPYLAMARTT